MGFWRWGGIGVIGDVGVWGLQGKLGCWDLVGVGGWGVSEWGYEDFG